MKVLNFTLETEEAFDEDTGVEAIALVTCNGHPVWKKTYSGYSDYVEDLAETDFAHALQVALRQPYSAHLR